jgi:hypothetical protein
MRGESWTPGHLKITCGCAARRLCLDTKGPQKKDDCSMTSHQLIARPGGFQYRGVQSTPQSLLSLRPYLPGVDALQSFVRTQRQPVDISADMLESSLTAEDISVLLHSFGNRRRRSCQRDSLALSSSSSELC